MIFVDNFFLNSFLFYQIHLIFVSKKEDMNNLKEVLVILGNGFDIALGMKTSYKHFYESDFWPFRNRINNDGVRIRPITGLDTYLDSNMQEHWYNLENLLVEYAMKIDSFNHDQCEHDKKCFAILKSALVKFVDDAQREIQHIYANNKAGRFLEAIYKYRNPIIYSFNYTNLIVLADFLCEIKDIVYTAVHGTIEGKNIIVGIEDNLDILPEYDFLKKVSEPTYRSNNLVFDLLKAKEVVFFGHSLGKNDYHFFRRFFQIHSDENIVDSTKKCKITFFTADAQSRMAILANLRAMNKGKNNQLFAQNDLNFIRTGEKNETRDVNEAFENWIKELEATKD